MLFGKPSGLGVLFKNGKFMFKGKWPKGAKDFDIPKSEKPEKEKTCF